MKRITLDSYTNFIMFLFILSLYIFANRPDMGIISNGLALLFVFMVWIGILINKKKIMINTTLVLYLTFISICLISVFYALDKNTSLVKVFVLLFIFIVMASLVNYIDTVEKLRLFMLFFVYAGLITSIYILFTADFSELTRLGSELGNVNIIGTIIALSTTICFYFILDEKKAKYILMFLLMLATILLTGSRKALLFAFLTMILIIYLKNKNGLGNKLKFLIISTIIIIVSIYLILNISFFYDIIGYRMENLFSFVTGEGTTEGSLNWRNYMIAEGLKFFSSSPLYGYGIDNFRFLFARFSGGQITYSHNNFIELMVGIGSIGVVSFYLMLILILRNLFRAAKRSHDLVLYTFISIIITYILLSISYVYYDSKHFAFILAVASAAISIVNSKSKIKTTK